MRTESEGRMSRDRADMREGRSIERNTTRVSGRFDGGQRSGRYVTIRGQRVVYGSPQYRRLVVVERRGGDRYVQNGRRRFVTIRGQRVVYGSPEYRRLVTIHQTGPRRSGGRYVVIRGQRVVYGSPEYRRLTVTPRGAVVTAFR